MAEKVKYKAVNIDTGEEHIGNVDELSAILNVPTGGIYRTATKGTHLNGLWQIEKITFKKCSEPSKRFPYKLLNDWDALTRPYIRRKELEMQEQRICIICNKPFVAKVAQAICCSPECGKLRKKFTQREYYKSFYVENKEAAAEKAKKKRKQKTSFEQDIAAADAMGVSYGIYVAIKKYGMRIEGKTV